MRYPTLVSPAAAKYRHDPFSPPTLCACCWRHSSCCYRTNPVLIVVPPSSLPSPSFSQETDLLCMDLARPCRNLQPTYTPDHSPLPKEVVLETTGCVLSRSTYIDEKRVTASRATAPPSRCLADLPPSLGQTGNLLRLLIRPSVWCNSPSLRPVWRFLAVVAAVLPSSSNPFQVLKGV